MQYGDRKNGRTLHAVWRLKKRENFTCSMEIERTGDLYMQYGDRKNGRTLYAVWG